MKKKTIIFSCLLIVVIFSISFYLFFTNRTKDFYKEYKDARFPLKKVLLKKDTNDTRLYKIPKQSFENGIMYQYSFNNKKALELKKGQVVDISLNIDSEKEHISLVYEYKNEFHDIYVGYMNKELDTSFIAQNDGTYYIYNIGSSATSTEINNGQIYIPMIK